jgi:hypothetical protein
MSLILRAAGDGSKLCTLLRGAPVTPVLIRLGP